GSINISGGIFTENKKIIKKRTRYTPGKVYYKTIPYKTTVLEYEKITNYCIEKNISKSCFMSAAAMYFIDNNTDIDEIYTSDSGENDDYKL
ncbi:MAG: hypothetical protein K2J44_06385, partial [Ruminococcus sp.]|nr:hypothetical protein [Ruminococcus sp.]